MNIMQQRSNSYKAEADGMSIPCTFILSHRIIITLFTIFICSTYITRCKSKGLSPSEVAISSLNLPDLISK